MADGAALPLPHPSGILHRPPPPPPPPTPTHPTPPHPQPPTPTPTPTHTGALTDLSEAARRASGVVCAATCRGGVLGRRLWRAAQAVADQLDRDTDEGERQQQRQQDLPGIGRGWNWLDWSGEGQGDGKGLLQAGGADKIWGRQLRLKQQPAARSPLAAASHPPSQHPPA